MTTIESEPALDTFVDDTLAAAVELFEVVRRTGVLSPTATIQINERVPGEPKLVGINHPNPWSSRTPRASASVFGFDGTSYSGDPRAARGARRFAAIFEQHPDVTTVIHIHTPYLGAWAQAHRALPVRLRSLREATPVEELPVYIDRRQAEVDFILEELARDARIPAIVEANGGATVWGRAGLVDTGHFIVTLELAARAQALAARLADHTGR